MGVDPDNDGNVGYSGDSDNGQNLSSGSENYYRRMVDAHKWIGEFTVIIHVRYATLPAYAPSYFLPQQNILYLHINLTYDFSI